MVLVFAGFSGLVFICLRRACFNILDPLMVLGVAVPFSALMLFSLVDQDRMSIVNVIPFFVVFFGYYISILLFSRFLSLRLFRGAFVGVLARFSVREVKSVVVLAVIVTMVLGIFAVLYGGYGDNRQYFSKLMRPLVIVQNGLFLLSLILLLRRGLEKSFVLFAMLLLLVFSIPFSGKSVLIPFAFWLGLLLFVREKNIQFVHVFSVFIVTFGGIYIMGALAYNATHITEFFDLIVYRFMMFGDVYIYAYAEGALESLRSHYDVSFLRYVIHPFTAIVGFRAYDKPLGSMLSSEVSGQDLLTGPNPQLPVILDFFFSGNYIIQFLFAFLAGSVIVGLRLFAIRVDLLRMRYMEASFLSVAVFGPQAGFMDFSLVVIMCISAGVVGVGLTGLEMLLRLWGGLGQKNRGSTSIMRLSSE